MSKNTEIDKQISEAVNQLLEKGVQCQIVFIYPDGEKITFNNIVSDKFRQYILTGFIKECQKKDKEEKS